MDFTRIKLSNENIAFWKDAISQSNGLSEDEKWCCLYVLMKKSLENAVTDEQRVMIIKDDMTSNPCPFYKCEEDLTLDMDFEKFELIIDDIMSDDTIWGKEFALYSILNVSVEKATTDEFIKRLLKYICKDNGDSYEDGVNFELFLMIYMASSVFAERGIGIMQKSLNMFYEDMPIDIEDKEFEDDIAPTISTEFYENLIGIDDIKQRQILGCLGVKSSIFDALYKYLKAGDKASFLELLGEIDITRASKWAKGIYRIENFSIERLCPVVKEHINKYIISNPTHHEDTELEEQSFDVNALRTQMEHDITQKVIGIVLMKSSLEQFREKGGIAHICISELDIIESHLSPILKSCTLTASERDLLISLNSDRDIYVKKYINSAIPSNDDAIEEAEEKQQVLDGNSFKLPKNFFDLAPSPNTEEFFGCADFLLPGNDVKKFESLINYIAEAGHIENSIATKRLLVFRLTGRWRPEGDLPKIKWYDENSLGLTISYLIVRGYDKSKNKYQKMKDFFEGPQWLDNDEIAKRAAGASTSFRRELNALYPKYFTLKSWETPKSEL